MAELYPDPRGMRMLRGAYVSGAQLRQRRAKPLGGPGVERDDGPGDVQRRVQAVLQEGGWAVVRQRLVHLGPKLEGRGRAERGGTETHRE